MNPVDWGVCVRVCVCVPCSSSRRKQRERQTSSPGRCDITLLPFNGHYESVAISDVVTNVSPLSLSPLSLSLSLSVQERITRETEIQTIQRKVNRFMEFE